jgi:HTH-type transcriptional regulator/antitoxin MqsA
MRAMTESQIELDVCPLCGGVVERTNALRAIHIGKRTVTLEAVLPQCVSCGESFLSSEEADDLQKRAAAAIREQEGLLSPQQIRSIRERLGLTQTQFENLLGAGPKTVVRWEKGTVFQNGATDTLLRILSAVPGAVRYAAHLRGVPVTPFSKAPSIAAALSSIPEAKRYQYVERSRAANGVSVAAVESTAAPSAAVITRAA